MEIRKWRVLFVLWAVIFTSITVYNIYQNRQRINDIQNSRLASCHRTYSAFLDVFRPFFPPEPKSKWTSKQRKDWKRLVDTTDRLTKACKTQVGS